MSQPRRDEPADPRTTLGPDAPRAGRPERLWREVVGEQLRAIRRSRGETLKLVATRAGVSPQYLSEIERGGKEPSSEILAAIGASLEITLLDLTTGVADALHNATARGNRRGDFTLAA